MPTFSIRTALSLALVLGTSQAQAQTGATAAYAHFEARMTVTGFLNPANPGRLELRLRRLFARARLEAEEVNILRGFLKTLEQPKRR